MNYDDIDFNKLYIKQKEQTTFKMKSKEDWDKKASFMNEKVHNSVYNQEFIEIVDTKGCETLLDVGCGVGNLSLKFSNKLKQIYSLDYSLGMLKALEENAKQQSINNINTINKSWYDSWDDIPKTDIVIASRSMEVKDMKDALEKLDSKANKRVYISYKVGGSFLSDDILKAMKREIIKKPDYIYLVDILYQMGINAKVGFVRSEGRNTIYTTFEDFIQSVSWSIGELSLIEIDRLKTYYKSVEKYKKDSIEYVKWAVIYWEK